MKNFRNGTKVVVTWPNADRSFTGRVIARGIRTVTQAERDQHGTRDKVLPYLLVEPYDMTFYSNRLGVYANSVPVDPKYVKRWKKGEIPE